MKRVVLVVALVIVSLGTVASAQVIEKPIRYTWIVTSCSTFDCAASAFMMANGSPDVIVLPTGRSDRPWLVLKRVEEGSIFIPEDELFTCNVFATVNEATLAYLKMDGCHGAMLMNVPDGRAVISSLAKCADAGTSTKRRAVH